MQNQVAAAVTVGNTADLFMLSDEQILDIVPETQDVVRDPRPVTREEESAPRRLRPTPGENQPSDGAMDSLSLRHGTPNTGHAASSSTDHGARATEHESSEPPTWLAAQMKDPWGGEEAREFWNGVQQAKSEAAAYREAIASPEDARALKELYPGGVTEARTAADRARTLEEIDRAYFGAAGNSPEQLSASRAQLAQRMLREDPAAFREMVEAGLQALQAAEQGSGAPANPATSPRLAQALATSREGVNVAPPFRAASSIPSAQQRPSPAADPRSSVSSDPHLAAYAAFERAANEDLERSVGSAIERTLAQALPVAQPLMAERRTDLASSQSAQARVPALRERLTSSVRTEVEKALQGDRQLGEQVAQILASRRFDHEARAQIVRLISDRAQQLVPTATKRVLNEWTQTTLAAHRGRTRRADAASGIADLTPASMSNRAPTGSSRTGTESSASRRQEPSATKPRSINYRKLSDEQILEM
jgi:hypothetical protein